MEQVEQPARHGEQRRPPERFNLDDESNEKLIAFLGYDRTDRVANPQDQQGDHLAPAPQLETQGRRENNSEQRQHNAAGHPLELAKPDSTSETRAQPDKNESNPHRPDTAEPVRPLHPVTDPQATRSGEHKTKPHSSDSPADDHPADPPGADAGKATAAEGTQAQGTEQKPDRVDEVKRVPIEGSGNTPIDPAQPRPLREWRTGDPPIPPGDTRVRDDVVYVRADRRDDKDPDSTLQRADATLQPHHPNDQRQAIVDVMRGHAAEIVGADVWSNSKYAGQTYDKLPPKMQERYPDGVEFSYEGFPQFDRYAAKTVIFEEGFRGPDREHDFKRANAIFGWTDEPKGMTWHHAEDGKTMLLVDTKLHAIGHWGGVRVSKQMGLWEGQD